MGNIKIKRIEFLNEDNMYEREIVCHLSNGGDPHICACCESWEIYNATLDEKYAVMDIADKYNGWLHGEDFINQ